jgi:iron complex outermembrane receptor protein
MRMKYLNKPTIMKKIIKPFGIAFLMLVFSMNLQAQEEDLYEMDLEALMQIEIVSASKKAEDIFDAPLGATVLTGEQIKESGATSIMEALRLVPGLIVRETTPGNYDIHLRGYDAIDPKGIINLTSNTMSLIMVNNRTVYSEFQGQTYWELLQINIDDIKQIEVVRGPVSAMYGPNAVTGVINILTKSPVDKPGFHASTYTMGGYPTSLITSTSATYDFDNGLGVRVSANADFRDRHNIDYFVYSRNKFVKELDPLTTTNTLGLPVLGADQPYLGIGMTDPIPNLDLMTRYPNENLAIERFGGHGHVKYEKEDLSLNFMSGYSYAKTQKIYGNNNIAALTTDSLTEVFAHFWGDYKGLNVSANYSTGDSKIFGSGKLLSIQNNVLAVHAEYDYKLNDNISFKPGVSYKLSKYFSSGLGSEIPTYNPLDPMSFFNNGYTYVEDEGDLENSVLGANLQADLHYDKFRAIGAIRVDKFQYPDKMAISPLISLTYNATDDFLIRGSYGRSSRTPFMFDLFFDIDLMYPTGTAASDGVTPLYNAIRYRGTEKRDEITGVEKGDYNLLTVDDVEVGFRHRISETFTLDIELFWSQISNMITLNQVSTEMELPAADPFGNPIAVNRQNFSYVNINAKPQQTGAMMSLTSVPFKKMSFQIFVMVQQTKIKDYPEAVDANGDAIDVDGDGENSFDYYHMATPAFIGGINMNYKPIKKLNFNLNSYFYSHQTLTINSETVNIDSNGDGSIDTFGGQNQGEVEPNIVLNATVNYEFLKNMKVFVTGRNLIGDNKRQYAFADRIGASVLGGINISF